MAPGDSQNIFPEEKAAYISGREPMGDTQNIFPGEKAAYISGRASMGDTPRNRVSVSETKIHPLKTRLIDEFLLSETGKEELDLNSEFQQMAEAFAITIWFYSGSRPNPELL